MFYKIVPYESPDGPNSILIQRQSSRQSIQNVVDPHEHVGLSTLYVFYTVCIRLLYDFRGCSIFVRCVLIGFGLVLLNKLFLYVKLSRNDSEMVEDMFIATLCLL